MSGCPASSLQRGLGLCSVQAQWHSERWLSCVTAAPAFSSPVRIFLVKSVYLQKHKVFFLFLPCTYRQWPAAECRFSFSGFCVSCQQGGLSAKNGVSWVSTAGNPRGLGGPQVPPEPTEHLGGLSGPPQMESFYSQPLPPLLLSLSPSGFINLLPPVFSHCISSVTRLTA